jgi:osmotically inducible protein OsmC
LDRPIKRSAAARWDGDTRKGGGTLSTHSAALDQVPYAYPNRFEPAPGTNPEELLAAALAACFTMSLGAMLTTGRHSPQRLLTQAEVTLERVEGSWSITHAHIEARGRVVDITAGEFEALALETKQGCAVARALRIPVSLDARLEEDESQRR